MIIKTDSAGSTASYTGAMVIPTNTTPRAELESPFQKLAADSGLEDLTANTLCKWDSVTAKMKAITLASDIPTHIYYAGTYSGGNAQFGVLGAVGVVSKIVTSEAVAIGDLLFVSALAKVSKLPATAGTYHQIGQALSVGAAANAQIRITTCTPVSVAVS